MYNTNNKNNNNNNNNNMINEQCNKHMHTNIEN